VSQLALTFTSAALMTVKYKPVRGRVVGLLGVRRLIFGKLILYAAVLS